MRGDVSDSLTSMRRTLGLLGLIRVFGRNPSSRASFALNFCRKSSSERPTMDLSDMRKKYKGDEEVGACAAAIYTYKHVCVAARLR